MAKRRLSKLQKWILLKLFEMNEKAVKFGSHEILTKRIIYKEFWSLDIPKKAGRQTQKKIDNSKSVILSRSLMNLINKDYIFVPKNFRSAFYLPDEDMNYPHASKEEQKKTKSSWYAVINLTMKGLKKAEELKDANPAKLNLVR